MEFGLKGHRIAILATDGVEQVELVEPRKALDDAGAITELVSLKVGSIQAFNHRDKGDTFDVDATFDDTSVDDYDGLVLPGGVANPDSLRMNKTAVDFIRGFFAAGKPVSPNGT